MPEGTLLTGGWTFPAADAVSSLAPGSAVEEAVREHGRLVYRVAFAILRNHHDAEDAAQEVFLKVLRLRRELEGVRDPKGFLARVAWRVAVDRKPRRQPLSIDDASAAPLLRDPAAPADDAAASAQLRDLLGKAIASLPEELRHVVELSTLKELTSADVGTLLGIPEGTVRTRLARARARLREALAPLVETRHGR